MTETLLSKLTDMLNRTAKSHHQAFLATNDLDDNWAIWYAEYLHNHVTEQFGFTVTQAELIQCLLRAQVEHDARGKGRDWPEFYAEMFLEHLSPASGSDSKLALYYFELCPFCIMVLNKINALGVDVELRNIFDNPQDQADLMAARGRATVPVLRITTTNEDRWMPESRDIMRYLETIKR